MKPPPIDEVSMNVDEVKRFQHIVENSDICVIPIYARRKFHSKYVHNLVKEIRKRNLEFDPVIDYECTSVLNDIQNCLAIRDTNALNVCKRDKWFIFIRPDLMDTNSPNVLSLGNDRITLNYTTGLNNRLVRKFSQVLDLKKPITEYPDEWSGFVSVWGSYMPFLTIVPEEWHLDVHYID